MSLFSPQLIKLIFQLNNMKNNHSFTSDLLEYTKSCTKKDMLRPFVKTVPHMRILKSLDLNKDQELYRKISNQNLIQ